MMSGATVGPEWAGGICTLIGSPLNDEACAALSSELMNKAELTKLHLSENGITARGAMDLAKVVASHPSLTSLDLWQNELGDDGASALAEAIGGKDSLIPFASPNVIKWGHLHVHATSRNSNTPSSSSSSSFPFFSSSSSSSILRHLELGANSITAVGAKKLAECVSVKATLLSLRIPDNNIGDEGVIYIAKALISPTLSLTSLDIRNNGITSNGCSVLSVSLKTNSSACDSNVGLKHLDIRENAIGAVGGWSMVEAVGSNNTLLSLRMDENQGVGSSIIFALEAALVQACRKRGVGNVFS